MARIEADERRRRVAPLNFVLLANALCGLVLSVDEAMRWTRGPAPDLLGVARMATFLGILALGVTQLPDVKMSHAARRNCLSTAVAIWLAVWSVTWALVR